MRCNNYKCRKETTKTDGSCRGKPYYICECGNRFLTEKVPLNDIDKWLAHQLGAFSIRQIAYLLSCSVGVVHKWLFTASPEKPNDNDIAEYVKTKANREKIAEIFGISIEN